jgi:hypothetical protein
MHAYTLATLGTKQHRRGHLRALRSTCGSICGARRCSRNWPSLRAILCGAFPVSEPLPRLHLRIGPAAAMTQNWLYHTPTATLRVSTTSQAEALRLLQRAMIYQRLPGVFPTAATLVEEATNAATEGRSCRRG